MRPPQVWRTRFSEYSDMKQAKSKGQIVSDILAIIGGAAVALVWYLTF